MTKRKLICSTAIVSALTGSAFADKDAGSMDQSAPSIIPDVTFSTKGKETVKLRFNGRLHLDYNALSNDAVGAPESTNTFYFRRLRFGVKATLANDWTAETVYDFANDDVSVDKAVIGYGDFKLGYQKVPFGFQENTSSAKIKTIERSAANRFFADDLDFSGRHTGIHYKTKLGGGFKFAAAVVSADQDINNGDDSNEMSYFGRLQWANEGFTVGVDYGSESDFDSGSFDAYTGYVNYKVGGFNFLGEYFDGEGGDAGAEADGYSLLVSYKFDKWEPVVRYSYLEVGDDFRVDTDDLIRRAPDNLPDLTDPNNPANVKGGEVSSLYVGVNYYYSESVKFMFGYEWAEVDDVDGAEVDDIHGVRARVQILF